MPYQDAREAFCLANTYGLTPPRAVYPSRIRLTNTGKYEFDYNDVTGTHQLILAHYNDKTNILLEYNPDLNLIIPYHVTGTLSPDAAGNYMAESGYKEKFTYVSPERAFFLWWDGIDSWIISDSIGWKEGPYWLRTDPAIIGVYAPQGGATGIATVVVGPE
jgi:hypothetical protein